METLTAFAILGLIANRGVDFLRNAFDKTDRIPKAWWLLAAWLVGIAEAFLVCNSTLVQQFIHFEVQGNCTDQVLIGVGFGSIAGFWHELLSRWGAAMPALTPKGLVPRSKNQAAA